MRATVAAGIVLLSFVVIGLVYLLGRTNEASRRIVRPADQAIIGSTVEPASAQVTMPVVTPPRNGTESGDPADAGADGANRIPEVIDTPELPALVTTPPRDAEVSSSSSAALRAKLATGR